MTSQRLGAGVSRVTGFGLLALATLACGRLTSESNDGGTDELDHAAPSDRGPFDHAAPETGDVHCTNPRPPGDQDACGPSCTGTCALGRCLVPVVNGRSNSIAVVGSVLYYLSAGYDLVRVPLGGGAPVTLATGLYETGSIAADETSVYWLTNGCTELGDGLGAVMKIPVGGGQPTTLASTDCPAGIALDAASVYWVTGASMFATAPFEGSIVKVAISGGATTTLATESRVDGIAVGADSVYWSTSSPSSGDAIVRTGTGAGSIVTLATGQGSVGDLAADATHVYWIRGGTGSDFSNGAVLAIAASGGPIVTLASKQVQPQRLAVYGGFVYWTNGGGRSGNGEVMRAGICGGAPTTLATATSPGAIAVGASSVYWSGFDLDSGVLQLTPR